MSSRILVVEDHPQNLELLRYLLTACGYDVLTAGDGAAAVALLRDTHPDLLLMDLHMPVMDGYEAVGILRADPQLRAIPVVAVSALAMVGDREKVLASGFDGYIAKPIDPGSFIQEISTFLNHGD